MSLHLIMYISVFSALNCEPEGREQTTVYMWTNTTPAEFCMLEYEMKKKNIALFLYSETLILVSAEISPSENVSEETASFCNF